MKKILLSTLLIAAGFLLLHCGGPEPAQLQKKWVVKSVKAEGGADPAFNDKIKKEVYLDLRSELNFKGRFFLSDTMFAYNKQLVDIGGTVDITRNETTDRLELNINYEKPEQLKGNEERMGILNASENSFQVKVVINEKSGDGRYRITFKPAE